MPKIAEAPVVQKPKPAKKPEAAELPILYPEIKSRLYPAEEGLTDEAAKSIIGWQELDKSKKADSHLVDRHDKPIRLNYNLKNRKFEIRDCQKYVQDILTGKWQMTGESMIVGNRGMIISAAHRLVALILACQEWEKEPDRWEFWKAKPTLPCLIVYGIDESDAVVNCVDTGRPRSFADVIYRSAYFADKSNAERDLLSRLLDNGVRVIEDRSRARLGCYSSMRPHAEGLDFLDRHIRLIECVKHIDAENQKRSISRYANPGYAAGLMYLMAAGNDDRQKYLDAGRQEAALEFGNWDLAAEFWVHLAQNTAQFKPVETAFQKMRERLSLVGRTPNKAETFSLLIKAWLLLTDGKKFTAKDLELDFTDEGDGALILKKSENVIVGGIDLGNQEEEEPASEDNPDVDPGQAEIDAIEARKAEVTAQKDAAKLNGKSGKGKKPAVPAPKPGTPQVGQPCIVREEGEGDVVGVLIGTYKGPHGMVGRYSCTLNGKPFEAPLDKIHAPD